MMEVPLRIISILVQGWLPALLFLIGVLSIGLSLLPAKLRQLPTPWPLCIAAALGWQIAALITLILGLTNSIDRLHGALFILLPMAFAVVFVAVRRCIPALTPSVTQWWQLALPYRILALITVSYIILMLIVASTPPTKHDDLWYHLVFTKRAVLDGGIKFYPCPWPQAAPHEAYSALLSWLLLFGKASSTLAFGTLWSLLFVWFVWLRVARVSVPRAAIAVTILTVAFTNIVWWTSASSTSILSMLAGFIVLWVAEQKELLDELPEWMYFAVFGTLGAGLCSSKLSFVLPVALIGVAAIVMAFRRSKKVAAVPVFIIAAALPALLLYGPWLGWSYVVSGNPFGVTLLDLFGSTAFDVTALKAAQENTRIYNQMHVIAFFDKFAILRPINGILGLSREIISLKQTNLVHPAFIVAGMIALVRRKQWELLAALMISSWVLAIIITHDLRFHALLICGLFLIAALWTAVPSSQSWRKAIPWTCAVLSLPVLAAAGYYSLLFIPAGLGIQSESEFLAERTGLYAVADWCNKNLPRDARICLGIWGMPRAFYFDRISLSPEGLTPAEVSDKVDLEGFMRRHSSNYVVSLSPIDSGKYELRKQFDDCILDAWRTPGLKPVRGAAYLYEYRQNGSTERIH